MSAASSMAVLYVRRRRTVVVGASGACLLFLILTLYSKDEKVELALDKLLMITGNGMWRSRAAVTLLHSTPSETGEKESFPLKGNRSSVGVPGESVPQFPSKLATNTSNILLLSSGGRCGSSFLGELMFQGPSRFYFFEPRHVLGGVASTKEVFVQQIEDLYSCNFTYMNFSAPSNFYAILRHRSLEICKKTKGCDLPSKIHMEHLCKSSNVRIIKTISYPLSWTESLMKDPNEKIRVIHLIRDPRGSIGSLKKQKFPVTCEKTCQRYNENIECSSRFNELYPDRFISITYEHLSQQPWTVAQELYHFVERGMLEDCDVSPSSVTNRHDLSRRLTASIDRNDPFEAARQTAFSNPFQKLGKRIRLPSYVSDYLKVHLHINIITFEELGKPYSTIRDTSSAYKRWRKIITNKEWSDIRSVCNETILKLHHRLFDNFADLRDMSQEYVLSKWKPRVLQKCQ